jgi:hypothetical protein
LEPIGAGEDDTGSISLVAPLFWAQNTLRLEAFVAIAIDELLPLKASMRKKKKKEGEGSDSQREGGVIRLKCIYNC